MNASRNRLSAVVVILLVVLAWLVLDRVGASNPLRDAFAQVLTPAQLALSRLGRPLTTLGDRVRHLATLERENQSLRDEVAALRSQAVQLREAQIENETLRRELSFKSAVPSYQLLSAEVVGSDPSSLLHYLIVDRGAQDGIRRGMPVLDAQGLVGRISEVSANSSMVMLITDPSSSVAALIQSTRGTGVVQGDLTNQLRMRYISPDDPLQPGDVVLTSGLGGNFPKRLVIGHVVSVERGDVQMFQEALVAPEVNLRDLEMVLVVLSFVPGEHESPAAP
jgi:rod shape-determining protein MreC